MFSFTAHHSQSRHSEFSRPWPRLGLVQFFETETVYEIDTCLDSSLVKNIAEGKIWREHPTYPPMVRTYCSITYIYPYV
jgi:hypothetical protein